MNIERLSRLIDTIYRAGEQRLGWQAPLEGIAEAFDARQTLLLYVDWRRVEPLVDESTRADPELTRAYHAYWRYQDAWLNSGSALIRADNTVVDVRAVLSERELRATAFYNEFLAPAGIGTALGINVFSRRGTMATIACMAPAPAAERLAERAPLARALLPHLRRALRLHRRLQDVPAVAADLLAALDRSGVAALVCDRRACIVAASTAAERILAAGDGLASVAGRLCALRGSDQARLTRAVAAAGEGAARPAAGGGVLRVARPSGALDYVLELSALSRPGAAAAGGTALVLIADPARPAQPGEVRLQAAFGLSVAQARVAAGLLAGEDLAGIAARLGVRETTVRTHLRALHRKLEVASRAELIRTLIAGLPVSGETR